MRFFLFLLSGLALFCLPVGSIYPQQDSLKENILIINSEPEGASVFIDSVYVGVTPLEVTNLKNGKYKAVLKMEGFSDKIYSIEMAGSKAEKFIIMSGDYGLLNITTEPSGADFYLNDIKIGQTPIIDFRLPLGRQKIGLKKDDYKEAAVLLHVVPYKYNLEKKLEPAFSILYFEDRDLTLYMDEEAISFETNAAKVLSGAHSFRLEGMQLQNPRGRTFELEAPQKYKIEVDRNSFTLKYILVSTLVPGLGQVLDGSYLKGFSVMLGTGLAGYYLNKMNSMHKIKVNDFNWQKTIYESSSTDADAVENYNRLDNLANIANDYGSYYSISAGVLIAFYAYNIFDVIYNHSVESSFDIFPYNNNNTTGINITWRIE